MSYINQSILPLLLMVSLALGACEREYQCRTDFFTDPERCESFDNRVYPNDTVPENSLAYYKATVEGRPTAMSDAVPGVLYFNSRQNLVWTLDQIFEVTNPGNRRINILEFELYPEKPGHFVGTAPVFLSFRSNMFDIEPFSDYIAILDTALAPGLKPVRTDRPGEDGWDIEMTVYDRITSASQSSFSGARFSTGGGLTYSDFNRLEITKMEKEDRGAQVRYHIRLSFQAEMYQSTRSNQSPGKFFTRIEDGEARLYLDVYK